MNQNIIKENNDFTVDYKDTCVMCNAATDEYKSTNVHMRHYYIEGAGQLCKKCYNSVYKNTDSQSNYSGID